VAFGYDVGKISADCLVASIQFLSQQWLVPKVVDNKWLSWLSFQLYAKFLYVERIPLNQYWYVIPRQLYTTTVKRLFSSIINLFDSMIHRYVGSIMWADPSYLLRTVYTTSNFSGPLPYSIVLRWSISLYTFFMHTRSFLLSIITK